MERANSKSGVYDFTVAANRASSGNVVLDLNPGSVTGVAGSPALDFEGSTGGFTHAAGKVVMDAFGYVVAKGGIDVSIGTVTGNDGGGSDPDVPAFTGRMRWR